MSVSNSRAWSIGALLKGNLLAFSLLFLGAHASLAQVATADLPATTGSSGGVATADLPGSSTPVGGVGTQEIPDGDIEEIPKARSADICNPGPDSVGIIALKDGNLLCGSGPTSGVAPSTELTLITGDNGVANEIKLDATNVKVTGLTKCDPAEQPENQGPVSIALDCTSSGGKKAGNTIDISAGSSLLLEGKLTFHRKDQSGNPDLIVNAGDLTVNGAADFYRYNDTFQNSGSALFNNGLALSSGKDVVQNSGFLTINGGLNMKMGADTISNSGFLTIIGDLSEAKQGTCGGGAQSDQCGASNSDRIENNASFVVEGDIVLGSGKTQSAFKGWKDDDKIENKQLGTLTAENIFFEKAESTGSDADLLENRGLGFIDGTQRGVFVSGDISFGRDEDIFNNQGTLDVGGNILLGGDEDVFRTDYDFKVGGVIDGGDGADAVVFGRRELGDFFGNGNEDFGVVSAGNFKNFEVGYQNGGNWDYDGDFSSDESGNARIESFQLEAGTLRARDGDYPRFKTFLFNGGVIDFVKTVSDDPALAVTDRFEYNDGALYIDARSVASSPDLPPVWTVIEGSVANAERLAMNTRLVTNPGTRSESVFKFTGLAGYGPTNEGDSGTVAIYPFHYAYLETQPQDLRAIAFQQPLTTDFELRLVPTDSPIDPEPDPDYCEENPTDPVCQGPIEPPGPDPEPDSNPPELIGCEDEDLCETLPPNRDPENSEEQQSIEIIDIIMDEIQEPDPDFEIPFIDYGQLARLLGSGLSPRNIDATGRGLQTYNNLLADTIFERLPLRQFTAVEPEPLVATPPIEEEQESVQQEPIRGLWSKTEALSDADAQQVMAQSLAQSENESPSMAQTESSSSELLHINKTTYIENPSLTAQYSLRDGWRAWFRGFGGNNRAYSSTTLYNDYSLNAGGAILGADVSLSDSLQIGFYGNYGNVNVNQLGDTGGGSWDPDGWGGGVTAEYWTDNFYVQGLIGASSFSGTQKRGVLSITELLGDDTASGGKNATSLLGALRVGAPFQSGGLYLEPQFTAIWTNNNEDAFTESGIDDNLRLSYGSRSTNYLETALGIKLAFPINSGESAEWVPNLKLAWLADWDTGNGDQSIGYNFTNRRVDFESQQSNQNGALIEAGLDYTVASLDTTSWKVFAKGGAEVWGGDRGTTWRASGGVTFQF